MKSIPRLLVLALLLGAAPAAQSQNVQVTPAPAAGTVFVVTYIDVALASVPQAIGLLRQYRDELRTSGNAGADIYEELGRPYRFAITEQWKDRATFDAHKAGPEATQLMAGLKDIRTAPTDSYVFEGYSVSTVKNPPGGRGRAYGISRFEIPAARLAAFGALVKPYIETSRAEHGELRFDVLQELKPHQNRVTILDWWGDPQDYENHRSSPAAQKFREGLAPTLIGSYDDRLYGKFD